jgi:Ser/Thr protein kinase RdoA (MazF antagonist)
VRGSSRKCESGRHRVEETALRPTDLVHGDLNPGNVFLDGDRISALVDVEALGKGRRCHDLATLLVFPCG